MRPHTRIDIPLTATNYNKHVDMGLWLYKHVGKHTKFADGLSSTRPWYMKHNVTHWTYYFLNEQDAVLFLLHWG